MKRVDVRRIYDDVVSTAVNLSVKLPNLVRKDGKYTVGGLTLVFFASRMGEIGRKADLNRFLRTMRCESTDPQPRHLGMQNGLNFLVKGCYHPMAGRVLRSGEYSLLDLVSTHPSANMMHRSCTVSGTWFDRLKTQYGRRCACCGSEEGGRHYKNTHIITTLDKGHCDPRKPLKNTNCIPMCTLCNMVYKDHAVFNRRGFIVEWLNGANGIKPLEPGTKPGIKPGTKPGRKETQGKNNGRMTTAKSKQNGGIPVAKYRARLRLCIRMAPRRAPSATEYRGAITRSRSSYLTK